MKKLFLVGLLSCCIQGIFAEDLESGVRDYVKNGDWSDFKIANSTFGNVEATRAATEDKRTNSSLALTYPTHNKCKLAPVEFIYKLNRPSEEDSQSTIYGNIQVDSGYFKRVEADLIEEKGSEFLFIVVHENKLDDALKNGKILTVNFKGYGVAEFSLKGAKQSIESAKFECENFDFN
ncbi:hypothetical protein ACIF8R_03525 [Acinetobacter sp. ABJ_C4_1]|uniref:hypothetical protein n=1 Tax=Acinetobacter sp. ABJ_C4_1 TaxID=3377080 RepID=UPI0037CCB052